MTDELKAVLAIALPVGALLVGAMVIYGPGAKIEGAPLRGRRRSLHGADENLSTLTPSEINRRLDRLDKLSSKLTREFIDAGRGYEKPSETRLKTDPLALRHNALDAEHDALHREISRRYGPGAPSRLPTRARKTFGGLGTRDSDPRVYWVEYIEAYAPNRPTTARIVADTRLSKAELRAKLLERDVSPDMKIVKVRSEAI